MNMFSASSMQLDGTPFQRMAYAISGLATLIGISMLSACTSVLSPQATIYPWSDNTSTTDTANGEIPSRSGTASTNSNLPAQPNSNLITLPAALDKAAKLELAYRQKVRELSEIEPGTRTFLHALGGITAYKALNKAAPATVAGISILGAGTYSYINADPIKTRQYIYQEGLTALTCLVSAARPLDIRRYQSDQWEDKIQDLSTQIDNVTRKIHDLKYTELLNIELNIVKKNAKSPSGGSAASACKARLDDCSKKESMTTNDAKSFQSTCNIANGAVNRVCGKGYTPGGIECEVPSEQVQSTFEYIHQYVKYAESKRHEATKLLELVNSSGYTLSAQLSLLEVEISRQMTFTEPNLATTVESLKNIRDSASQIFATPQTGVLPSKQPPAPVAKAQHGTKTKNGKGIKTAQNYSACDIIKEKEINDNALKGFQELKNGIDDLGIAISNLSEFTNGISNKKAQESSNKLSHCKTHSPPSTLLISPLVDQIKVAAGKTIEFTAYIPNGIPRVFVSGTGAAPSGKLEKKVNADGSLQVIYTTPSDTAVSDNLTLTFLGATETDRKDIEINFEAAISTEKPKSDPR
jgi:hypothetical protein